MTRTQSVWCFLTLTVLSGAVVYWHLSATPPAQDGPAEVPPPANSAAAETEEGKVRRLLLGIWQDEYKGKRTMTLKEDGTGTMLVELSGLQAALFASRLRFDLRWSLREKTLTKRTTGGEPADKVNLILNTMGNTAEDTLLELTDSRLLLLDKDGKTRYDWKRVSPNERTK